MAYSFESYKVRLLDRQFIRADGYTTPKTAVVELLDAKGAVITSLNLAVPDMAEIYEIIGRNEMVNLDHCYVHGFSSAAAKRYLLIEKSHPLPLKSFSATHAFFESLVAIDFSGVIVSSDFLVDESYFVSEQLDFHGMEAGGVFSFTNCFVKVGRANFTQTRFGGGKVSFKNTMFDGGFKDFQDADFGAGEVVFTNVDFGNGDVSFINALFNDSDVDFRVSRFGVGKVDFHYARFGSGGVSFERVDFGSGRVDFRATEFGSGRTSFNRSVFHDGEVNFEGAETKAGKLTFKRAQFGSSNLVFDLYQGRGSDIVFERSLFNAGVSFSEALIGKLQFEECHFNSTVNLHVKDCDEIDLAGCTIRDIVEFYTHGDPPQLSSLNLAGARLLGRIYIDWNANNVKRLIYNQKETTIAEKGEQFRILKENFNSLGRYDEEDAAYVEFKRCELKASLLLSSNRSLLYRFIHRMSYGAKKLLFDYMGLYATSPQRVLVSILAVYFLYSILYVIIILSGAGHVVASSPAGEHLGAVARGFYFSVVTFFTIGYGDFSPDGIARIIAGTEGFMGVFLMAYFTVAFVRKILR